MSSVSWHSLEIWDGLHNSPFWNSFFFFSCFFGFLSMPNTSLSQSLIQCSTVRFVDCNHINNTLKIHQNLSLSLSPNAPQSLSLSHFFVTTLHTSIFLSLSLHHSFIHLVSPLPHTHPHTLTDPPHHSASQGSVVAWISPPRASPFPHVDVPPPPRSPYPSPLHHGSAWPAEHHVGFAVQEGIDNPQLAAGWTGSYMWLQILSKVVPEII